LELIYSNTKCVEDTDIQARDGSVNIKDRNDTVTWFRFANPYVTRNALRMSGFDRLPSKHTNNILYLRSVRVRVCVCVCVCVCVLSIM